MSVFERPPFKPATDIGRMPLHELAHNNSSNFRLVEFVDREPCLFIVGARVDRLIGRCAG